MAIAVWSATTGISTGIAPVLGGFLVENYGWRLVFLVNVPVGCLALAATRVLKESKAERPRPFDFPGQLSIAASLFLLTYGLISAPMSGWDSATTLSLLIGSGARIAAFVVIERRSAQPMLPLAVFRNRAVTGAFALAVIAFLALGSFLFFNTLYLQDVRGYSPLHAGLLILPTTAIGLVLSPISGHLTGTRGARLPTTIAALFTTGGMALLALILRIDTPILVLLISYLFIGVVKV